MVTGAIYAGQVTSARYEAETDDVVVDVQYGGGCKKHTFEIQFDDVCLESLP